MKSSLQRTSSRTRKRALETLEPRQLLTRLVDLDLDGDLDAYFQSAWFENTDSAGNFVAHRFSDEPGFSSEVSDLDGDGDWDFVTSEPAWFENTDGEGKLFERHEFLDAPLTATRIKIHDVGGDGDIDVIFFHGSRNLTWYERTDAGFAPHSIEFESDTLPIVDASDIDLDGDLDLAMFGEVDDISMAVIAVDDGQGDFLETVVAQEDPGDFCICNIGRAEFADIDGDGLDDYVHRFLYDGISYSWRQNRPTEPGQFDPAKRLFGVGPFGAASIFLGFKDFDKDGDLDAVVRADSEYDGMIYENIAGDFQITVRGPELQLPFNEFVEITDYGDVNGDGAIDWLTPEFESGAPLWFDGATGFPHVNELPQAPSAGDANLDSYFDEADLIEVAKQAKWQQPAVWSSGDWDGAPGGTVRTPPVGNGLFDAADLQLAEQSGHYRQAAYAETDETPQTQLAAPRLGAGDADLMIHYDRETGEVEFTTDMRLSAFQLRSIGGYFVSTPPSLTGVFDVATTHDLFRFDLAGFQSFELGALLPAGLNWEQLANDLKVDGARFDGGGLGEVQFTCSNCGIDVDYLSDAIASNSHSLQTDLNQDAHTDQRDLRFLLSEVLRSSLGDANLDGTFNSADFVSAFDRGHYEDTIVGNSKWADGDWNGDREFTSADIVFVMQHGDYVDRADVARVIESGPLEFVPTTIDESCGCSPWVTDEGVADLDGDGDLDLLAVAFDGNDSAVVWHKNLDGLGTFGRQRVINDSEENITSTLPIDVDLDGDLDVVITTGWFGTGQAFWVENVGGENVFDPTFHEIDSNEQGALRLAAGDLDGDGDTDLVFGVSHDDNWGRVVWHENQGAGGFLRRESLEVGRANQVVEVIDMDGDGDLDVFSANFQQFTWYENQGNATFSPNPVTRAAGVRSFQLGDADQDGHVDVISSGNRIVWFQNLGDGSFREELLVAESTRSFFGALPIDLDGDADVDILPSHGDFWLENTDGSGQFEVAQVPAGELELPATARTTRGDIDGDGVAEWIGNGVWFDGYGHGRIRQGRSFEGAGISPRHIDVVDLDADEDFDIVANTHHINRSSENRFDRQPPNETAVWTSSYSVDLDGDGDFDTVVHYQSDLFWLENENGEATFGAPRYIRQPADFDRIGGISFDDVDLDGDVDIIAGIDSQLSWFENRDGRGRFDLNEEVILDVGRFETTAIADLDGDGLGDLLSSKGWYPKLSTGGFGDLVVLAEESSSIVTADFDQDGDQDVVVSNNRATTLYENLSNSRFKVHGLRAASSSLDAGDLDGDGDIDVVFTDYSGSTGWLELNGELDFTMRLLHEGDRSMSVKLFDIDQDGDLDVLRGADDGILLLENQRLKFQTRG